MKAHEPLDGEPSRHLVAEDNYAAGYAHQNNIQTDSCPHPQVNLEQSLAHPKPLGVLQPLLPSGQCFRTLSYWQLVDQPLRLIFDFHSVNPRCDVLLEMLNRLRKKPRSAFSFVQPVLDEAGSGNVV